TENVPAEITGLVRLTDSRLQPALTVHHFTADVDEAMVRTHRVRGNDAALDQRVRIGHHQRNVLAGARFPLISVDDEIVGLTVVGRHEPLVHAGGEAGTSPPPQARVLDQLHDLFRTGSSRFTQPD